MSLYIASLNSGSNGNCYYIGNDHEAVLIDAGLSCRETERRMRRLGLSMDRVKGVFISHEHDDHIRGLEVLSKRYQLPVYITENTLSQGQLSLEGHLVRSFATSEAVSIGSLNVLAFSKTHDAIDPHSFVISAQKEDNAPIHIGVFTDIGHVCDNLTRHFKLCHAAFLEANYDEQLLEEGRYPWPLKNRIRGGKGHLSNHQALELFVRHRPAFMSHLLLAHLSQDNNKPELAQTLFEAVAEGTHVVVASRYGESEVYAIDGNFSGEPGIGAEAEWDHQHRFTPIKAAAMHKVAATSSNATTNGQTVTINGQTTATNAQTAATPTNPPTGEKPIGHSMIRRRKKALTSPTDRPEASTVVQTSLF
jgi:phosphoribosyl 1,2-cyclic phosphodiesterase